VNDTHLRVSLKAVGRITAVNEPRNTNPPISITVLCACLGLLIIGVPAQGGVRRVTTEVAQYGASSTQLRLAASVVSSLQVLKLDARWLSDSAAQGEGQPQVILYSKTQAHTPINQVLNITCLPRAALSDSPAKSPAAI
jgi:hypothetical protein